MNAKYVISNNLPLADYLSGYIHCRVSADALTGGLVGEKLCGFESFLASCRFSCKDWSAVFTRNSTWHLARLCACNQSCDHFCEVQRELINLRVLNEYFTNSTSQFTAFQLLFWYWRKVLKVLNISLGMLIIIFMLWLILKFYNFKC